MEDSAESSGEPGGDFSKHLRDVLAGIEQHIVAAQSEAPHDGVYKRIVTSFARLSQGSSSGETTDSLLSWTLFDMCRRLFYEGQVRHQLLLVTDMT